MNNDIPTQVRVRTDPEEGLAHRYEAIEQAKNDLGVGNKTKAILMACDHVRADRDAKIQTIEYLCKELPAPKVEQVCELLSTDQMKLDVEPREITIE